MAKKKRSKKIGKASKKCVMYSKKTGKRIRTKAERKKCMQRELKGGKSGRKRKVKKRRKKR